MPMEDRGYGSNEAIDPALLPPLYVACWQLLRGNRGVPFEHQGALDAAVGGRGHSSHPPGSPEQALSSDAWRKHEHDRG